MNNRDDEKLRKLIRIARADVEAGQADLADVADARSRAERALTAMDEEALREGGAPMAEFSGAYFEGVAERRRNIRSTLAALSISESETRERLNAAVIEMKKLETLLERRSRKAKQHDARREQAASDDIATMRASRR